MQKIASVSALIVLIFLSISQLQAQERQIKGKVIADSTKEPLVGVTVHVKGKAAGTATQADGTFTLTVNGKASTLVFSSVGFENQELPIGSGEINVSLKTAEANSLSQVVVVGYGSLKRNQVTSAVADVKPEDFNQGGARNVVDLIQGKVAGVNINRQAGASPNSSPVIQIRSATSLSSGNGPLIVVDGIPGGNLDLLQQDDIASFDILKDGSAAAIYGTQANGGVILITTKKGRSGPPRFDYNSYVSKLYVRQRPDFLTASQYRAKALTNPSMQPFTTGDFNANVDMFDSVVNHDNVSNYHNLAMSGGGPNGNYRASVYYSNFEGIGKADTRQQYGARFSLNQRGLQNRLSVQLDLVSNYNKANLLGGNLPNATNIWLTALTRLPTMPTRDSTGAYYSVNGKPNPISDLAQDSYLRDQNTTSADGKISLEIWKGIKAGLFGSITRDSWEDNKYNDLLSDDSRYNDNYPEGGYAYKGSTLNTNYAFTPTLEYSGNFGDHSIGAVAGYNYQYEWSSNWWADNRGFQNDLLTSYSLGDGQALTDGKAGEYSYKQSDKLIAFFGRVNYSYLDRYFIQAVLRHEGSSKFGANHKWGDFPAVSAGWDIAREGFMKNTNWISQLKLRAGYGVTGNSNIGPYNSLVTLGTGGQYANPDGVYRQTYGPSRNPNPNLKWEKKAETNVGVDFSMFENRLSGSIDGFYRKTTDLLYDYTAQLPPYVQGDIYTNVGSMSSKGIELALSGIIIKSRDFSWKMDLTASTTNNKIISFSNQTYNLSFFDLGGIPGAGALGNALRFSEGGKVGNFYGHKYAGVDASGNWLFYKADGKTKVGLDQITDDDKMVIGNAIPKYYLSWTNSFTYKNWDLRMFWRGRFKYDILNAMDISYGNQVALPNNVLNDAFGKYANLKGTYQYSSLYVQSASFFKLDNITAGYTFKLKTDWIRSLRLYASVSNIAEITKYKGNDPDYVPDVFNSNINGEPIPGVDAIGAYPYTPSSRNFLIGLNLGF